MPTRFQSATPLRLRLRWLNDGVAPLYEPCHVALALLDANDAVVEKQWVDESRPGKWEPGVSKSEELGVTFPHALAGTYKLAIGLFLDRKDAAPAYRLAIQGRTAQGWYVLCDRLQMQR